MDKQVIVGTAISCVDDLLHEWQQRMGDEPIFITIRLMRYKVGECGAFSNVCDVAADREKIAVEMRKTAYGLLHQADHIDRELRDG